MFENYNTPFDGFDRAKFNEICDKMSFSFKPKLKNPKQENSTVGALHQETVYGLLGFEKDSNGVFVIRKSIDNLTVKDLPNIIDTQAEKLIKEYGETEEAFNKFKEYCEKNGIKKIRKKQPASKLADEPKQYTLF